MYTSKEVMEKQGSNLLVARDRSTCIVSDSVFSRVQVDARHRCVWDESDLNSTRIRPGTLPTPRRPTGMPLEQPTRR